MWVDLQFLLSAHRLLSYVCIKFYGNNFHSFKDTDQTRFQNVTLQKEIIL